MITSTEFNRLTPKDHDEWAELHRDAISDNPFTHPDWIRAFVASHGVAATARVLFSRSADRLIGVVPLDVTTKRRGRAGSTTLGMPLVDNGTPLVAPGKETAFADDLLSFVEAAPGTLTLVEVSVALGDLLHRMAQRRGLTSRASLADGHFAAIGLPDCGRVLKTEPPFVRRIRDDLGAEFEFATQPRTAALLEVETLRLASIWARRKTAEVPAAARSSSHTALWREILSDPRPGGCLGEIATLRTERGLLAGALSLVVNDRFQLVAQKATDTRLGNRYSPGMALDWLIMKEASKRGRAIDFGRGDEPYKGRLGMEQIPMLELRLARPAGFRRRRRNGAVG